MKKRILAAILAAGMVFSMAGCSGESDDSQTAENTDGQDSGTTAEDGEARKKQRSRCSSRRA